MKIMSIIKIIVLALIMSFCSLNAYSQWLCKNPLSGDGYNVYVHMQDSLNGYICKDWGKLVRTTDGGKNWNNVKIPEDAGIDISRAAFFDMNTGYYLNKYLYYTNDGCETWKKTSDKIFSGTVTLHAFSQSRIIVTWGKELYLTDDSGATWKECLTCGNAINDVDIVDDSIVYIITNGGIYKTTDGCNTWDQISTAYSTEDGPNIAYGYSLYFINKDKGFVDGMKYTEDGGKTWKKIVLPVDNGNAWLLNIYFFNEKLGFACGNTDQIFRTEDGGKTWQAIPSKGYYSLYNMYFTSEYNGFCVGQYGAIYHTTDRGLTWKQEAKEMTLRLYAVCFPDKYNGVTIGTEGMVLTTNDMGETWQKRNKLGNGNLLGLYFKDDVTGYIIDSEGYFYKTTDKGLSWQTIAKPFDKISEYTDNSVKIKFWDENNGLLLAQYLYKTSDGGKSWNQIGDIGGKNMYFITPENGYIVGNYGSIYHTLDGGLSWEKQNSWTDIYDLVDVCFYNDKIGFITGYGGTVLKTKNGGKNWIPQIFTSGLVSKVCFADSSTVYMTNGSEVYKTKDFGQNWESSKLYYYKSVRDMWFWNDSTGLLVGDGAAIYKTTNSGLSTDIIDCKASNNERISVFPNPASDNINVVFYNTTKSQTTINIIGVDGRLIKNLYHGMVEIGKFENSFAVDCADGLYLIRITSGNRSQMGKVLIKR
jgi:photosystem II stability/assembly factor-like uncharacterized protein